MEINLSDKNIISVSMTKSLIDDNLYNIKIIKKEEGVENIIILPSAEWDSNKNIVYTPKGPKKEKIVSSAPIMSFTKENDFLSNFYPCKLMFEGLSFNSAEAAFQAAKTQDIELRKQFVQLTAAQAKWKSQDIMVRKDWAVIKDTLMYKILLDKFTRNYDLREKLLDTKNASLINGNNWHDNYWGNCNCDKCKDIIGENKIGSILMKIRSELEENND